jgi:uncharacterized repeat protein (TIGR03803 family)
MPLRQSYLRSSMLGFALLIMSAGASSAQTFTVLITFGKAASNPWFVTPAQGRDGRIYGTTLTDNVNSAGTVFALDVNTGLRFTLHRFDTATGASPGGGMTLGTDGNFYGTTQTGGTAGYGVLYKLTPGGTYTVLHNFAGGTDGRNPSSPPLQASDGNFYGTTGQITAQGNGPSTAYQYTASGTFTSFGSISATIAPLIQGADGNLYGTSNGGCGTVFELSTAGVLLNDYPLCGSGGAYPIGPVMQAADGNFYGVQQEGGISNYGAIYKMDRSGSVSLLYNMPATAYYPDAGLVQGTDGNLYGSGWGAPSTLFQITTAGTFTLLQTLTSQEGAGVGAALLQHTNGKFYGTGYAEGGGGGGALFSLDTGLAPFVSLVKNQGRAGSLAQIIGQGLTGSTGVTFNGVPAKSFHVASSTYMTAVVPAGASTGPVVVTTPSGTLTSNRSFQVVP